MLASNPGIYSLPTSETKSIFLTTEAVDIPEKRLERLTSDILFNSNQLSLIGDNLSTNTNYADWFNDKKLDDHMKILYEKAMKVSSSLMNIANVYGTAMGILRITQTVNLVRNKVYMLDGDLISGQNQPILYNNKQSIKTTFTGNYRCLIIDDYNNYGLAAVDNALDDFNIEFNEALSTVFIAWIDIIAEAIGIPNLGEQFPLMYRTKADVKKTLPIPVDYISSTSDWISQSISNEKVALNSFQKNEESIELSFFTSDLEEQPFTFDIDYEHGQYNINTTTISARLNPYIPAKLDPIPIEDPLVGQPYEPLPIPVQVIVKNKDDIPIPGVSINFYTDCEDCGHAATPIVPTNGEGIAETIWLLGGAEGFDYLKAKVVGHDEIPPVEFTATVKILVPAKLEVVASTNNQCGKKEMELAKKIQALVTDASDNPVMNVDVEFYFEEEGFGSFNPWVATTNEKGIAESTWTLGWFGEQQRAKVKIVDNEEIPPVEIFADTGENCSDEAIVGSWELDGAQWNTVEGWSTEWLGWGCNIQTTFEFSKDGSIQGHWLYHENICDDNQIGLISDGKWEKMESGEYKISFTWFSERENRVRTDIFDYGTFSFPDEQTLLIHDTYTFLYPDGTKTEEIKFYFKKVN